ncbi:hypothetical protein KDA00_02220 [Candidatus Saccharibacteria bacterium]|nr:hypothetical protein [Candidatus Saccharibacteria bacterium]
MAKKNKYIKITYKKSKINLLLDRVLIFRFFRQLHGRFWGVVAISGLCLGLAICFAIRPDLLVVTTAFSDFGNDVRTAPYFAGSVFFAAYGLWRWRNYITRTLKHKVIFYYLLSFMILGLYTVALMPVSWKPWPYRIHLIGFALTGASMAILVISDGLISKTRKTKHLRNWRIVRIFSFGLIIIGGVITFGSLPSINWFDYTLIGETMMLLGFMFWVIFKTYLGEGAQSRLSILAKKIGIIG